MTDIPENCFPKDWELKSDAIEKQSIPLCFERNFPSIFIPAIIGSSITFSSIKYRSMQSTELHTLNKVSVKSLF